jgi:hypothetical protein
MRVRSSALRSLLLLLVVWAALVRPVDAQFRASIQGTVNDASGAPVPGATVVVTNQDTGVASETITSEAGFYRVSGLAPGRYSVRASLSGFKEALAEDVVVSAEEARGLDLTLETGSLQETVTVTAGTPTLRTENAEISGTFSTVEIKSLPQVGRDPYELARLAPGVFGLGARDGAGNSVGVPNQQGPGGSNSSVFGTENQVPISANGQRVEANNFQLDGVTAMSQAWGGAAVVTPNQESVKEIRVISSSYSAENGRNTGAQVQVVSQNGTNDFHGSLVFKRNTPGLNSYQSDDWVGPAGELPERVNRRLSQTAGSVGGPIFRNKLFFFFSFEASNSKRQLPAVTEWVETPELVSAIKSQRPNSIAAQFLNYPGMTPPTIGRVLTTVDVGSITGSQGQAIASPLGGGLDGVPDLQQVQLEGFENQTARQYNGRIDYSVTPSDLVAFSTYFVPVDTNSLDPAVWGNTARPVGDFTSERRNMVGTLLWTRTLGSTLLNEARFNVTRWYFDEIASNPEQPWGLPRLWVNQPVGTENPLVSYGPGIGPGVFYQTTYNFRDTVTKVINTHALKIGGDIIFEQNNDKAPWAGTPEYHFSSLWNFANDAPFDEVAFFDPTNGAFTDLASYARTNYYALYVQDDWKARRNLTINAGLRWEYFSPLQSKNDQIANLILGANGGLVDATLKTGGDLYEKDQNNFGPQIGAAWTPDFLGGRGVVRGGFGVSYNRLPGSRLLESRFNPPFFAGFTLTGSNVAYRTASNPTGFDYPNNPAAVLTFDPVTGLPTSGPPVNVNATAQELPNPYIYRYSVDTDYEIGRGWVASVGYQGSQGHNLARPVPYQLFVPPNPRLGTVNMLLTDVDSQYNALLTRLTRRYADGYMFSVEYRLGESTDTCSSDQNCRQTYPFDQSTEEGPSDFDVRHSFKMFGSWDLPIFRDRRDLVGILLGGWQLSGIVTASSGYPWTPVFGGGLCQAAVAGGGVCPLRPIAYTGGALDDTSNETFMQQWGQFPGGPLQYFTPPPTGSFTEVPRPGVGRNSFRGPNYFSVDATLVKRFGLPDMRGLGNNVGLEFRVNAFNVFNNLNLRAFEFNTRSTQIENSAFGQADKALAGRVVEFQGRFSF